MMGQSSNWPVLRTISLSMALQRLDSLSQIPDYANYLVFTLTQLTSEEVSVRSVAGLILKNHLYYNRDRIPPASLEYIKAAIMPALSYQEDLLRRTATQVVAMLMAIQGPANWPEGLEKLVGMMTSQDINEAEVSGKRSPRSRDWIQLTGPCSSCPLVYLGSLQHLCQDV